MLKKINILFALYVIFLLTGCSKYDYEVNTVNYSLYIDNTFKEKIVFTFSEEPDSSDYTGIEGYVFNIGSNYPINSDYNTVYNKKINRSSDKVEVILDYEYTDSEFLYSNNMMKCFENYDINSKKDYFEISLSGNFNCYQDGKIFNIFVETKHDVINANGEYIDDGYRWVIDNSNKDNIDIKYKIAREYSGMATSINNSNGIFMNILNVLKYVVGIVVIVLLLIWLYKFYQRRVNNVVDDEF